MNKKILVSAITVLLIVAGLFVITKSKSVTKVNESVLNVSTTTDITTSNPQKSTNTDYNVGFNFDANNNASSADISKDGKAFQTIDLGFVSTGKAGTSGLPRELVNLGITQFEDINFDGFMDLYLITNIGATGNTSGIYFVFNPETQKFEYSQKFSVLSGAIDINDLTKEISVYWNLGCVGKCYSLNVYKVLNNEPVLIKEVSQSLSDFEVYTKVTRVLQNGVFVTSTTTNNGDE